MKKRQETALKKPRIIEKHLLPVLYCVPIDLQALVLELCDNLDNKIIEL